MKVYIDGENARKGLTRILQDQGLISNSRQMTHYRLRELLEDVLKDTGMEMHYYASEIRLSNGYTPAQEVLTHVNTIKAYTRQWVPELRNQNIAYIKAGYLKVKSGKECRTCHTIQDILQEKGVDVRIATDMLEDAYDSPEDTIVIMSSDTDLTPAMHKVIAKGKKIIYVCFADSVNRAIVAVASQTLTISIPKVEEYFS